MFAVISAGTFFMGSTLTLRDSPFLFCPAS